MFTFSPRFICHMLHVVCHPIQFLMILQSKIEISAPQGLKLKHLVKTYLRLVSAVVIAISANWYIPLKVGTNLISVCIMLSQIEESRQQRRSDQRIVIFPANRNRNRFAESTSVRIGMGIVCEFQNLGIGIGIIFVRWEVFASNSQIPDIYFF